MGEYTTLTSRVELSGRMDGLTLGTLMAIARCQRETAFELPDHPFFLTPRWWCIAGGYGPQGKTPMVLERLDDCWLLYFAGSYKDYGGEAREFARWLAPLVNAGLLDDEGHYLEARGEGYVRRWRISDTWAPIETEEKEN